MGLYPERKTRGRLGMRLKKFKPGNGTRCTCSLGMRLGSLTLLSAEAWQVCSELALVSQVYCTSGSRSVLSWYRLSLHGRGEW